LDDSFSVTHALISCRGCPPERRPGRTQTLSGTGRVTAVESWTFEECPHPGTYSGHGTRPLRAEGSANCWLSCLPAQAVQGIPAGRSPDSQIVRVLIAILPLREFRSPGCGGSTVLAGPEGTMFLAIAEEKCLLPSPEWRADRPSWRYSQSHWWADRGSWYSTIASRAGGVVTRDSPSDEQFPGPAYSGGRRCSCAARRRAWSGLGSPLIQHYLLLSTIKGSIPCLLEALPSLSRSWVWTCRNGSALRRS